MTGDHHIGEGQKPCENIIGDDTIRKILEEQIGFLLVNIQGKAADGSILQPADHREGVDHGAPTGVDQHHAALDPGKAAFIDKMMGLWRQRAVQGDKIGMGKQGLAIHIAHPQGFAFRVGNGIVCQHGAAESREDACDNLSDLSRSHDSCGLAVEIESHQPVQGEVSFTHPIVGAMDIPVEGEDERKRMLGHGMGRIGRNPGHRDAKVAGGPQIDLVEPGAAKNDQAHAPAGKILENLALALVIDEKTHRFGILRQRGRPGGKPWFQIHQPMPVPGIGRVEKPLVVGFGAEYRNFHGLTQNRDSPIPGFRGVSSAVIPCGTKRITPRGSEKPRSAREMSRAARAIPAHHSRKWDSLVTCEGNAAGAIHPIRKAWSARSGRPDQMEGAGNRCDAGLAPEAAIGVSGGMVSAPPILSLRDTALSFGNKLLFRGLSIFVSRGDRLALVGLNGTGKSTLMKCLAGQIEPDGGERFVQPGTTIALVPQELTIPEGLRLADWICEADTSIRDGVRGGIAPLASHEAEAALVRFGLDPERRGEGLSGGEARRAALARAFARMPDVLLLDEPTNHLDIAAIESLEADLKAYPGAVILISHDRAFLEATATATLWLQRRMILRMDKPFSQFESWSEEILAREIKEAEKLNRKIDRETHWLHRGVTARRKRNQGRLERLKGLRAARRDRQIGQKKVGMGAAEGPPASQLVADVVRIAKSFPSEGQGASRCLIEEFSTRIMRGDRVGLLGPNGSGKTTLLRILLGELAPDSGRVKLGRRTEIAYFDQARRDLDPAETPWSFLCPEGGDRIEVRGATRHVVGYLKQFLFDEDDARAPIATLSGGQRNRLMLARILAQPSNVLVLDEPTNDLDMDTLDTLQETLSAYDGTLIVVSHDRDFLDQLVTSLIVLEGEGRVVEYIGGYRDYLRQRRAMPKPLAPDRNGAPSGVAAPPFGSRDAAAPKPRPAKLSYKDVRALETLPGDIAKLERAIAALEQDLADPDFFNRAPEAFASAARRLEESRQRLDALETLWLELEERRESLSDG